MNLNKKEDEQQELLEKAFFSYVGYHHVQNINQELDEHSDEIKTIEVPHSLDERVYKKIKEIEGAKNKIKSIYHNMFKTKTRKVASIFLILAISMATLTMSVEAFRVRLFNMIIEEKERYMSVRVEEESPGHGIDEEKIEVEGYYVPDYIPEGFELDSVEGSSRSGIMTYINQKGQILIFDQHSNSNTKYQLDSEDALVEDITINGAKGILIEKGNSATIFWNNDEFGFTLLAEDVQVDELLRMAESVNKK